MFRVLMIPLVLTGMLSLSACGTPSVIIEHQTIILQEPEIYQHCMSEPTPPPVGASNRAWKDYQLDLKEYGNDCESKVNSGREWAEDRLKEQQSNTQSPEKPQQNTPSWWKFW